MHPWKRTLFFFGLSIIVLLLLIAFIGGDEAGRGSFNKTQTAIDNVLKTAENQFTSATTTPSFVGTGPTTTTWLDGADDDPWFGSKDAAITIVEFSDFQCPFCKEAFPIIRGFVFENSDKVHYIYRDFPVDEIHPDARRAAEAGACAQEQDAFWPFHDRLFQNQSDLSESALTLYAQQSGIDMNAFQTCLNAGTYRDEVELDRQIGLELGVQGTPTWFINGEKIEGVIPREVWDQIITAL